MHRLVSAVIVVEALHYVDFSAIRPHIVFMVVREKPYGRPCTFGTMEPGTNLKTSGVERFFILGPDASGKIRGRIFRGVVIDNASELERAVAYLIKARIGRLGVLPVGSASCTLAPCGRVNLRTVEILLPGKPPLGLVGVRVVRCKRHNWQRRNNNR